MQHRQHISAFCIWYKLISSWWLFQIW